ncbi:hypothetical protein ANN_14446 [Periplaneta americana]|uniref:Uncharacterized protein n=1 Tax=Periplaneta americana TaxID=6978 RepID=A0ABQ8SXJ4_PERAM|nr:hypothetical protein ANN_14446 [Periplaneta americana]
MERRKELSSDLKKVIVRLALKGYLYKKRASSPRRISGSQPDDPAGLARHLCSRWGGSAEPGQRRSRLWYAVESSASVAPCALAIVPLRVLRSVCTRRKGAWRITHFHPERRVQGKDRRAFLAGAQSDYASGKAEHGVPQFVAGH